MKKQSLRWIAIYLTMPTVSDLRRGMEIATKLEDRHGGHPAMCFGTISGENILEFSLFTVKDKSALRRMVRDSGAANTVIKEVGPVPWEHCHAYQVAKHLSDKPFSNSAIQAVILRLHCMLGCSITETALNHQEIATALVRSLTKRSSV